MSNYETEVAKLQSILLKLNEELKGKIIAPYTSPILGFEIHEVTNNSDGSSSTFPPSNELAPGKKLEIKYIVEIDNERCVEPIQKLKQFIGAEAAHLLPDDKN